MAFTKNDEAVSPVIGVILMVAITVILAAVIAAFVFGMAGNISKTKVVAATVQQPDGQNIVITYQGGQDAGSYSYGTVTVTDSAGAIVTTYKNITVTTAGPTGAILGNVVGSSVTATGASGRFNGKDHVVVTGTFSDGTSQVLLDSFI